MTDDQRPAEQPDDWLRHALGRPRPVAEPEQPAEVEEADEPEPPPDVNAWLREQAGTRRIGR